MRFITRVFLVALLALPPFAVSAQTDIQEEADASILPQWGIKTNLLSDVTTTFSLGVEFRLSEQMSLDMSLNWNPWTLNKENRKWKHIKVQPELRWWTQETFNGHFFGLHAHYAFYNVGNLPKPFSPFMQAHRFEGWLAGLGVSYGYRWNFNHRWALEATIGLGYAYMSYNRYECRTCGELIASETDNYFGPTKIGLSLIYGIGGHTPAPKPVVVAPPVVAPVVKAYEPNLTASFIVPEVESVKVRSESYSAYLDFEQGRSEILPDLRNNRHEIRRIHDLMNKVMNDPDATITGICITGYASPEGTYDSNMSLSERRTYALRDYINTVYNFNYNLFTIRGAGEDWATLDSLVGSSNISEKYMVLDIIRGYSDFDAKENRLKSLSGGRVYRQLYNEFYPRLRRSDYQINYTVVPFTVEKGKKILRTRPGNLSLNEMFLIANTYEPGSRAFNEVFEIAAKVFPDSDVANINAAAIALEYGDTAAAARYLASVKERTAAYWNNLGVLSWLQGDKQKAAECFANAGRQSAGNAAELDRHFRSLK